MKRIAKTVIILALAASPVFAREPDCGRPDSWPAASAFGAMKNAGIVRNDQIDFSRTKVRRIASSKVGRNLWKQVHLVEYFRKDGSILEAITVSDASDEECSMGDVQTFVVSSELPPSGR